MGCVALTCASIQARKHPAMKQPHSPHLNPISTQLILEWEWGNFKKTRDAVHGSYKSVWGGECVCVEMGRVYVCGDRAHVFGALLTNSLPSITACPPGVTALAAGSPRGGWTGSP